MPSHNDNPTLTRDLTQDCCAASEVGSEPLLPTEQPQYFAVAAKSRGRDAVLSRLSIFFSIRSAWLGSGQRIELSVLCAVGQVHVLDALSKQASQATWIFGMVLLDNNNCGPFRRAYAEERAMALLSFSARARTRRGCARPGGYIICSGFAGDA